MCLSESKYKCNICEIEVDVTEGCLELLAHVQEIHKEVYELHKDNTDSSVGYQIEFLQFSMKDQLVDLKTDTVILSEICEAPAILKEDTKGELDQPDFLILPKEDEQEEQKQKTGVERGRKRSWVWKYFEQLTKTIYRCTLCHSVLSIKGSNSNNMNRHVRTRHTSVYVSENTKKEEEEEDEIGDVNFNWEESTKEDAVEKVAGDTRRKKQRCSWVWSYFNQVSRTRARCKICKRIISHGGNATGNMNRHLKIVHNKRRDNCHWVWKVFDAGVDTYSCKICPYQFAKFNLDKSIHIILEHLKDEHSVISGSQIVTSTSIE